MAVGPTKTGERRRLVDLLLGLGLIDRAELQRAQSLLKQSNSHLLRVIVDQGWVDEDRLTRALSSALSVESVTPATMKIHERVLSTIPAKLALRHRALPVAIKRSNQIDYLYVALADPLDADAIEEISKASSCKLNILIAPPTQLDAALARFYGTGSDRPIEAPQTSTTPGTGSQAPRRGQPSTPPAGSSPGSNRPQTGAAPAPQKQNAMVPEGMVLAPRSGGLPPASVGLPAPTPAGSSSSQRSAPPPPLRSSRSGSLPAPTTRPPGSPQQPQRPSASQQQTLPSFPRDDWSRGRPAALEAPPLPAPIEAPPRSGGSQLKAVPIPDGARPQVDADLVKTQLDTAMVDPDSGLIYAQLAPMTAPLDSSRVGMRAGLSEPAPPRLPAGLENTPRPQPRVVQLSALIGEISEPDEAQSWDVDIEELTPDADPSGVKKIAAEAHDEEDHPVVLEEVVEEVEPVEDSMSGERSDQRIALRRTDPPGENGAAARDLIPTLKPGQSNARTSGRPPPPPPSEHDDEATGVDVPSLERFGGIQANLRTPDEDEAKKPQILEAPPPEVFARTMELPIEVGDVPSPFDLMRDVHLKAGLERTGIIPAIDWDKEGFEPPGPLNREPSPLLAGVDDIPSSPAAVKARLDPLEVEGRKKPSVPTENVHEPPAPPPAAGPDFSPDPSGRHRLPPSLPPIPPPQEMPEVTGELVHEGSGRRSLPPIERRSEPPRSLPPPPPMVVEALEQQAAQEAERKQIDRGPETDPAIKNRPTEPPGPAPEVIRLRPMGAAPVTIEETGAPSTDPTREASKEQLEEVPTNPRISVEQFADVIGMSPVVEDPSGLPPLTFDLASAEQLLPSLFAADPAEPLPLEPPVLPPPLSSEKQEIDEDSRVLVEGLMSGDSLTSAERAQLVLALGRILIKKGLITREELIAALSE